jgi:hypothetical protein
MMEQLDLLELHQKDELIQKRLNHLYQLLEKYDLLDLNIVAVNKYYEWSCLVKEGNSYYHYSVYDIRIEKRSFNYPFEQVVQGELNFILI